MAAPVAPTFADMLAADSDFVMPTDDKGVQAALTSFVLATALGLDFQAFGTDASWPAMLARRVIAHQALWLPSQLRPSPSCLRRIQIL